MILEYQASEENREKDTNKTSARPKPFIIDIYIIEIVQMEVVL